MKCAYCFSQRPGNAYNLLAIYISFYKKIPSDAHGNLNFYISPELLPLYLQISVKLSHRDAAEQHPTRYAHVL